MRILLILCAFFLSFSSFAGWKPVMKNKISDIGCGISEKAFPHKKVCIALVRDAGIGRIEDRGWDFEKPFLHVLDIGGKQDQYFQLHESHSIDSYGYYRVVVVIPDDEGNTELITIELGYSIEKFMDEINNVKLKPGSSFSINYGDTNEHIRNLTSN